MPEKVFFEYVPAWLGNRARYRAARAKDPSARPECSIEIHPLSAIETKAVKRAAIAAAMPRKGETEIEVQERAATVIEQESRKVFLNNVRNPVGFKTLDGRELSTLDAIWDEIAPQLLDEILGALEDQSKLQDGLRDRLCSPSDGTPPATTA